MVNISVALSGTRKLRSSVFSRGLSNPLQPQSHREFSPNRVLIWNVCASLDASRNKSELVLFLAFAAASAPLFCFAVGSRRLELPNPLKLLPSTQAATARHGQSKSPLALISAVVGNSKPMAADIRRDHPTKLDNGASVLRPITSKIRAITVGRMIIPMTDDAIQRITNESVDN